MQEYNKTDQQLHWLNQTLAKANRTYVTPKDDDSHTNLYYDDLGNRILGRWIDNGQEKIMLTLNLHSLHFEWVDSAKKVMQSVTTIGRTANEIENELAGKLSDLHLKPQGFTDTLHFQIPDYPLAGNPIEPISEANIQLWKSHRKLANELCNLVLGYLGVESEIRIWPHHFDTGIYVEPNKKLGLGFGLAMEDAMAGAAYFYMSGYDLAGELKYNDLPKLAIGRWEIGEHWQGAILPIMDLSTGAFEENRQLISDYLLKATNWFLSHK